MNKENMLVFWVWSNNQMWQKKAQERLVRTKINKELRSRIVFLKVKRGNTTTLDLILI